MKVNKIKYITVVILVIIYIFINLNFSLVEKDNEYVRLRYGHIVYDNIINEVAYEKQKILKSYAEDLLKYVQNIDLENLKKHMDEDSYNTYFVKNKDKTLKSLRTLQNVDITVEFEADYLSKKGNYEYGYRVKTNKNNIERDTEVYIVLEYISMFDFNFKLFIPDVLK